MCEHRGPKMISSRCLFSPAILGVRSLATAPTYTFWACVIRQVQAGPDHREHHLCRPAVVRVSPLRETTRTFSDKMGHTQRNRTCSVLCLYMPICLLTHSLHSTPLHSTPLRSAPLRSAPLRSTPLHSTPLHSTHSLTVSFFVWNPSKKTEAVAQKLSVSEGYGGDSMGSWTL